jgi:hypothetical protein
MANKLGQARLILPHPKVCTSKTPGGPGVPANNWRPAWPNIDGQWPVTVNPAKPRQYVNQTQDVEVRFDPNFFFSGIPFTTWFQWRKGINKTLVVQTQEGKCTYGPPAKFTLSNPTETPGDDIFLVTCVTTKPPRRGYAWFKITWFDFVQPPPYRAYQLTPQVIGVPRGTTVDIGVMHWDSTKPTGITMQQNWQQIAGPFQPTTQFIQTTNVYALTGIRRMFRATAGTCQWRVIFNWVLPAESHSLLCTVAWT